jgi:hypothetical protein
MENPRVLIITVPKITVQRCPKKATSSLFILTGG